MTSCVGVGVEGISDKFFLDKLLNRVFPHCRFHILNMKNRSNLIRESPKLLEAFRSSHYKAGIILIDRDDDPCATIVTSLFPDVVKQEFVKPIEERYLFLAMAVKDIESWYLSDEEAIKNILPAVEYNPLDDTSGVGKGKLKQLWKGQFGKASCYNEPDFAQRIAPRFDPERAKGHSPSFLIAWDRITRAVNRIDPPR